MIVANFAIPLVPFILNDEQNIFNLGYNCLIIICSTVVFMIYIRMLYRYGKERLSDKVLGNMVGIPFVIIMIFSIFIIEKYNDFSIGLIGIEVLFLSGTLKQYLRIGRYIEQKNTNRYGNVLKLVTKEKEGEKK